MTTIRQFIQKMNELVPEVYKESYDNVGLLVGDHNTEISGVLCCLDSTEAVIDEAQSKGCNLIVAHHPILFKGIKRLNEERYVHRVIRKSIKKDIAIFVAHTNLDNILENGVNQRIADRLELMDCNILSPKRENLKIAIYASTLRDDILEKHLQERNISWHKWPVADKSRADSRYEIDVTTGEMQELTRILRYEEFDYELNQKDRPSVIVGSGIVGSLSLPLPEKDFLSLLREKMKTEVIRHTALREKSISKVAICGGAGSFLLPEAIRAGADAFVTADFKYHEFFDADNQIVITDIGHYESEQFTINLLHDIVTKNFSTFAVYCTEVHTNPVYYNYG